MSCAHELAVTGKCWRCGMTAREIASSIEPAWLIEVDPAELLAWEGDQDRAKVESLMAAMRSGCPIPPIAIGQDGRALHDGHHRMVAAREAGYLLRAVVIPRSWRGVITKMIDQRQMAQMTCPESLVDLPANPRVVA